MSEDLETRVQKLEEAFGEHAKHSSWRCGTYQDCHCGLDETCEELGLPKIPYSSC